MTDRPRPRNRVTPIDRILGLLPPFLDRFGDGMIWLIGKIKSGIGWLIFPFVILRIMIAGSIYWKGLMRKKQGKRIG